MASVTPDLVRSVAHDFERAIRNSLKSAEDARPALTMHAVQELVQRLRAIDAEIGFGSDAHLGQELRNALRAELRPLWAGAPLWNRALAKPRGYAGDFEMLRSLYRNEPVGTDPLGRELDRLFLVSPLAETVRKRKDLLVKYLSQTVCD
jgi:hypothetical protein